MTTEDGRTRRQVLRGTLGMGALLALAGGRLGAARAQEAPPGGGAGAAGGGGGGRDGEAPRLLVLGGTGFLGPQVVEAARRRGWKLTLFNRGKTRPQLFAQADDVEILHGDRDGDLASLAAAIAAGRRWAGCVDTSGYVPRVVTDSARLLAPAVDQYLFISTISVFGDSSIVGMQEDAPVATLEDETNEDVPANYGALKALCEQVALREVEGRATVVRPGLIVGPGDPTDRFTYWPVRMAEGGEALAPGDGSDPVQVIDVRDLAEFSVAAIERRLFGTYNATGPAERLAMKDCLEACAEGARLARAAGTAGVAERPATPVWVPTAFLEEQNVSAWQDLPAWVPGQGETAGFATVDCRKAIAAGLAFRPLAETARDTLADWAALPEPRRAAPRAGLTRAREAEVLAAWKQRGS